MGSWQAWHDIQSYAQVSDTVVGAHFGRAGQGPEMDPQKGELGIGQADGGG